MDQATFTQICNQFTVIKDDLSLVIKIISDQVEEKIEEDESTRNQKFFLRAYGGAQDSTSIYRYSDGSNGQKFSWTGILASNQTTVDLFVFS